jgi:hypothetical protein
LLFQELDKKPSSERLQIRGDGFEVSTGSAAGHPARFYFQIHVSEPDSNHYPEHEFGCRSQFGFFKLTDCRNSTAFATAWKIGQLPAKTSCQLPANFLQTSCELPANFLRTSYELPTHFLRTSYQLPANFLPTSCQLPANFLSTSSKLPPNFVPTASTTACQLLSKSTFELKLPGNC